MEEKVERIATIIFIVLAIIAIILWITLVILTIKDTKTPTVKYLPRENNMTLIPNDELFEARDKLNEYFLEENENNLNIEKVVE